MVPENSAEWGQTLCKSTPKSLKPPSNRTAVSPWDLQYNWKLCAVLRMSWSEHGFQHLATLFYQRIVKFNTDNLKPTTLDSFYAHT